MTPIECPLCREVSTHCIERLPVEDLALLYERVVHKDFRYLFEGFDVLQLFECTACSLLFFHPPVVGDSSFYATVSEASFYYPESKIEFDLAQEYIFSKDTVLDVGCGAGEFGLKVANYTGIDINESAVIQARANGLRVFQETIGEHARTHEGRYDVVCLFQVLEHMQAAREFIENCLVTLRSKGRMIIAVPSADSFLWSVQNHLLNLPPHHVTWWTDSALRYLPTLFPLSILRIHHEKVGDEHLDAFLQTFFSEAIGRLLGVERRRIYSRSRIREKMVNRTAAFVAKRTRSMFRTGRFRPDGHTVVAIYQKN